MHVTMTDAKADVRLRIWGVFPLIDICESDDVHINGVDDRW